ncbi:catechol 2,3-dioxygenase-like lactoylglutathione lyase family enzyme [Rhizobium tibeticum]|uniref:Catechol 2,3-dioxygenase n=1 Tax=Rhizobium tibeticum TaxID=501024 RepID=A0A1H8WIS9_9HYPH|nr:catechol 2,3-dioxygenase-like lactoylglutathione lyase family enzyme [Rhizobium tibeticum]SEI20761.1 Glyoxalase-like domain protein [Rhizobium tibeticum]SEP27570.1 Catechol 2,3-dioxygenase [Rhizobium tibeticum]
MPIEAPSLNLVVLRARDPGSLAAFYKALGFEFQIERHGSGPEHLASTTGGSVFEIYPKGSESLDTSAVRLGFRVPSISTVLSDLGTTVDMISRPSKSDWGTRCVIRDPEGHKIELLET